MRGWSDETAAAFEDLIQAHVSAPVLIRPDWPWPFRVHIDSSQLAVGVTITQFYIEEKERVIVCILCERLFLLIRTIQLLIASFWIWFLFYRTSIAT